ncbi:MAG: hypothetical protein K8F91_03140 [Candidatus Obscuribacterales bacterium]|nr:hypothetical protein [Candidatus Obscuribacterales bacterium]
METPTRDKSGKSQDEAVIAHEPLVSLRDLKHFVEDQIPLGQCFLVAVCVHVVLLPVIWIMGWALPWPKPPVITTIIEYDLTDWPQKATPKKVFKIIDPDLN